MPCPHCGGNYPSDPASNHSRYCNCGTTIVPGSVVFSPAPPEPQIFTRAYFGPTEAEIRADERAKVEREIADLKSSVLWHRQRMGKLQAAQLYMRDPERTIVCDILANGTLLPDPRGVRYGHGDIVDAIRAVETGEYRKTEDKP